MTESETRMRPDQQTSFGFQSVTAAEKTRMVGEVFASVAGNYDIMNDAMSAGVHRLWKARFVAGLGLRPGMRVLDLAGGTGDIAFAMIGKLGRAARRQYRITSDGADTPAQPPVTVCDINPAMLMVGRDRAIDRGLIDGVQWSCGNAERLPFPDRSFDRLTIAFGLRNVTDIDAALAEAHRVLRPGGKFFCLEFSKVAVPGFDRLYDLYSFQVIPRLGQLIAGDRDSYQYLVESIRQFPDQQSLCHRMRDAGMDRVGYRNLSGGIAAIHSGWRI